MADGQLLLPAVQRVESGFGSHIEPPMSETWSERDRLAWHAAVCALDSGLTIRVVVVRHVVVGLGDYCLQVHGPTGHSSSMSSMSYREAWTYLNGVRTGAQVGRVGA